MEVASSNPFTVACVFFFRFFFDFIFLLIYLFFDIIHYHFQTISVDKYRFNDCKNAYPIELMHASMVNRKEQNDELWCIP